MPTCENDQARMQASAVKPSIRPLKAVEWPIATSTIMKATILTMNEPSAATIIAIGLIFAARPTTRMLIPKNTATTPTPISDP